MTRKASPRWRNAISKTPPLTPLKGFASSAIPPRAAIESARGIHLDLDRESLEVAFCAPLSQEIGRIAIIGNVVIYDNELQRFSRGILTCRKSLSEGCAPVT